MLEVVYVVDRASGWENDTDVCWVIDEGSQTEWGEDRVCIVLDA